MNPFCLTDFYKVGHPFQYPKGTSLVYSNLTPRKSRLPGIDKIVWIGLQLFAKKYLIEYFNDNFFNRPKQEVMDEYKRVIKFTIGDLPTYEHIEYIYDLGYLPIEIKALPEGSIVDMRIPVLTIKNTDPKAYWLTNFLESLMSAILWQPITSATLAYEYKKLFTKYLKETIGDTSFVQWMGHDFSFRGMSGLESAILSGIGHLMSFTGTDTIPAIMALEKYYNANIETELVGASVPATEHSVMSSGTGVEGEFATFKRLITEIYPNGIVSIVSDTFNLWDVLTDFLPRLKNEIMARDGKVVIRPDSGDPVDIICGKIEYDRGPGGNYDELINPNSSETKGVIELLWDTFGGTIVNGYKVLDSHIGAIYGDSITLDRAKQISERLIAKGFAPLLVYGIGSFTYQYNTRDTFGIAVKATYIEITEKAEDDMFDQGGPSIGEIWTRGVKIFKDPITDDGTKKSARGLLKVEEYIKIEQISGRQSHDKFVLVDQVSWEEEAKGALKTVFLDGKLVHETTLKEIRSRLN
jgi:nicotinamide phosphoribosyltransferase